MKIHPKNPRTNRLSLGVSEGDIQKAVSRSGYPLQHLVAGHLQSKFKIQEEWSYFDKDSNAYRNIDILAEHRVCMPEDEDSRIYPYLDLLIECKRSDLPFIFFLSSSRPSVPYFPQIAGLFNNNTMVSPYTGHLSPILRALNLNEHPFLTTEPYYCMTFTKAVRKGKEIEFSGTEAFNGLIQPILKAEQNFILVESPVKTSLYFDCHLVVAMAVIDAPMIGVCTKESAFDLILLPWVRVVRHVTEDLQNIPDHLASVTAIDVIHKDFLGKYLNSHLLPFSKEFSKQALLHHYELASNSPVVELIKKYKKKLYERTRIRLKRKR